MSRENPFHAFMPTDIEGEISLAESLYTCGIVRYGKDGFSRRMRTDPIMFFTKCHYVRIITRKTPDPRIADCAVVPGFKGDECFLGYRIKASIEDILTPSHEAYAEFSERLLSMIEADDFEWNYAPGRTGEYWPLASAEIIRSMGFAVAETLTLFAAFLGESDRMIYDHVAGLWAKTRPRKGLIPFDARRE